MAYAGVDGGQANGLHRISGGVQPDDGIGFQLVGPHDACAIAQAREPMTLKKTNVADAGLE